jgi:thioredoxin-like negative regulator of GroEL
MANRFGLKPSEARVPTADAVPEVTHVKELLEKDFEAEVVGAPLPVVVDFYAKDSKPCEALAPRYAAVAEKFAGKVLFLKLQRDQNAALASKLGVVAGPTVLFFKGGQELGERLSGDEILRTALKARVEALLK